MKHRLFLIALIILWLPVKAQNALENDRLFYNSCRSPQSNALNPALFPQRTGFYLTLPSPSVTLNLPWSVSDIAHYDAAQEATIIDLNTMLNALNADPNVYLGTNVDLIGFGFKARNHHFNFSTRLVAYANVGVPDGIINFLTAGNIDDNNQFINNITLVDGELFTFNAYAEAAVGYAYTISPLNLTIGARAKLLGGIANIHTTGTNLTLNTAADGTSMGANLNYNVQAATLVPIDSNFNPVMDFSSVTDFDHGNLGYAFDLGLRYTKGPLTLTASVLDLSQGIHWQQNTYSLIPANGSGQFVFNGIDLVQAAENGNVDVDSIVAIYKDQLENIKPVLDEEGTDYYYSIPTRVNVGAALDFMRIGRVGLLFQGLFDKNLLTLKDTPMADVAQTFRYNVTLTAGLNLGYHLELMACNAVVFDGTTTSYINPGAGLYFGKWIQLYLMVNHLSSIYATEIRNFNLCTGVNILLGSKDKKFNELKKDYLKERSKVSPVLDIN